MRFRMWQDGGMEPVSKNNNILVRTLERIHLISWIMGWESAMSTWRAAGSATLSILFAALAPLEHMRPMETFVLALALFALVPVAWSHLRPLVARGDKSSAPDAALQEAPNLHITCHGQGKANPDGTWHELFGIDNNGGNTATGIAFGGLTWTERKGFALAEPMPQIAPGNHEIAHLALTVGNGHIMLGQFLRQPEVKPTIVDPTVTVTFQDPNGNRFCCDYALRAEINGEVTWNPIGLVRPLKPESGKLS